MLPLMSRKHYPVAYLLRVVAIACLLPGIVGLAIFLVVEYYEERQRLIGENIRDARFVIQAVDNRMLRAKALARSFAGADEILSGDLENFSKRAARAIAASGLGSHVLLHRLDDGRVLRYSSTTGSFSADESSTEAVRTVFKSDAASISNLIIEPRSGRCFVEVHVPAVVNGRLVYAVGIAVPAEQFTAILLEHPLPASWLTSLTDRNGVIAARSRLAATLVGKTATTSLREGIRNGGNGSLDTITRDGVANLTAFSTSPLTGYTAVIGVPQGELIAPLRTKLSYLAISFIVLLGLGLLLARLMTRQITNSVKALVGPASALGRGEAVAVAPVHLTEVAEVASAIERAAELLARRDAVLRAQQAELQRFHFFSENANEILLLLAEDGSIRYANRMASTRLGYSNDELLAMTIFQIDVDATPAMLVSVFDQCRKARTRPFERQYQCSNGSGFPVEINATVLEYKGEWLMHVAPRDISERLHAEQALRWTASHDALTGLANRTLARELLDAQLAIAKVGRVSGALLYIDLDRFKPVNDLYGHETGDRVLLELTRRMQALMKPGDLLARVGGDEFIAILPGRADDGREAATSAGALTAALSQPVKLGNIEVKLSASVGISRFPEHGSSAETLIHAADLAMLQAKQDGRNAYCFYTPSMDERVQFVLSVERRIQQALERGTFTLHFQPIVNLATGKSDAVEALVRLEDGIEPTLGPASFIPVAEMCGLIAPLGQWVAHEACRQHAKWKAEGLALQVSVNVSAIQFQRADFLQQVRDMIAASGIGPQWLIIELTETAVMQDMAGAAATLVELKSLGVTIALDDFGTGFSSLSILSTLPIDKLKIDQSFVRRIDTDHASRAVIDAVIALAKSLDLQLVAEGIETATALAYLKLRGCQLGQGYYFSRPLPAARLLAWHSAAARDANPG